MNRVKLLVPATAALLAARLLLACGDDDQATSQDAGSDAPRVVEEAGNVDAGTDAGEASVAYRGCPGQFSGLCADIQVPLDYANPDGKKISIFVDQIVTNKSSKKVLWLLQGGPGASGSDLVTLAQSLAPGLPDFDIYTLDHRGVGLSSRLGCPQETAIFTTGDPLADAGFGLSDSGPLVQPCIDAVKQTYGADLAQYNTSNAARDLNYVINATKRADQEVYVYGVSYGTTWAHRYLQIFPDAANGVVLDSIVAPVGEALSRFDLHGDLAGMKLAELCKQDAVCSAKLGPDPWTHVKNIVATIGTGHCPELGLTQETRRFLFAFLQTWGGDVYPFAALWRYERCSAEDVTVLKTFAQQSRLFDLQPGLEFAPILYYNVGYSEIWEDPAPSDEELRARFDNAVFPAGQAMDLPHSIWPTYPKDEYWGKYAVTQTPLLMLNGTLDVQTPIETASQMKDHLNGPHQTFVTIPNANHGTVFNSPTTTFSKNGGQNCGLVMMEGFLENPTEAVDQSCLNDLAAIDFSGVASSNAYFFGTTEIWTGIHANTSPGGIAPPLGPFSRRPRTF